jgi:hypothetical protein
MDIPLTVPGPHAAITVRNAQEQFLVHLWDRLWHRYRARVPHVAVYEQLVNRFHARFVNDHIAFRTFANQRPLTGISSLARIFEALGYRAAGLYTFEDKFLQAIHYQHPHPELPKLFVSELQVWRLPEAVQGVIERTLADHRPPPARQLLTGLHGLANASALSDVPPWESLLADCVEQVESLPWSPPEAEQLGAVDGVSQYAAWVLVHGYNVNHFTSLINSHQVPELADIERTVDRLREAGVPMKAEIEGAPRSILRQTATAAAMVDVAVLRDGKPATMPWTYAYFELAERGETTDPATGQPCRFEGFLGAQATQLFEMTRRGS